MYCLIATRRFGAALSKNSQIGPCGRTTLVLGRPWIPVLRTSMWRRSERVRRGRWCAVSGYFVQLREVIGKTNVSGWKNTRGSQPSPTQPSLLLRIGVTLTIPVLRSFCRCEWWSRNSPREKTEVPSCGTLHITSSAHVVVFTM